MGKDNKFVKQYGDYMYFVARVLVGFMFALHGAQKLGLYGDGSVSGFAEMFGFPVWLAGIVALIEFVGGLGVALGFYVRPAACLSGIVMIAAYFIAHAPQGLNPLANGGELALMYLSAFLVFKIHGAGKWSLEKAWLGKETY